MGFLQQRPITLASLVEEDSIHKSSDLLPLEIEEMFWTASLVKHWARPIELSPNTLTHSQPLAHESHVRGARDCFQQPPFPSCAALLVAHPSYCYRVLSMHQEVRSPKLQGLQPCQNRSSPHREHNSLLGTCACLAYDCGQLRNELLQLPSHASLWRLTTSLFGPSVHHYAHNGLNDLTDVWMPSNVNLDSATVVGLLDLTHIDQRSQEFWVTRLCTVLLFAVSRAQTPTQLPNLGKRGGGTQNPGSMRRLDP